MIIFLLFPEKIVNHDYKPAKWRWLQCLKHGRGSCSFLFMNTLKLNKR